MMREAYIIIHHALHSDQSVVNVNGVDYPILKASNGCRYVTFEGVKIMEQNKSRYKTSIYAVRARAGEKLTWVMIYPSWILIDDAAISSFSKKQGVSPKTATHVPKGQFRPGATNSDGEKIYGAGDHRATRKFWRSK